MRYVKVLKWTTADSDEDITERINDTIQQVKKRTGMVVESTQLQSVINAKEVPYFCYVIGFELPRATI